MDNFKYKQWLNSYSLGWSNTLNIDKRTNRKEFFEFVLVDVSIILISLFIILLLYFTAWILSASILYLVLVPYILITQLTSITILCRRIKDTGRSTAWMFWYLVPFLGTIILFLIAVQPSSIKSKDSFPIKLTDNINVNVLGTKQNLSSIDNENPLKSKLSELNSMLKDGLISEDEYDKLRKKYLDF